MLDCTQGEMAPMIMKGTKVLAQGVSYTHAIHVHALRMRGTITHNAHAHR